MTIVEPTAQDYSAIDALLAAAFGSDNDSHVMEIDLVRGMRRADDMALELIDRRADTIIGHLAFSPMQGGDGFYALAPLSVLPNWQRQGVGAALVRRGLNLGREQGWNAVFVLGDPAYYTRFGFSCALAAPFDSPYAGEHFMVLELVEGGLRNGHGSLRHAPIFEQLEGVV